MSSLEKFNKVYSDFISDLISTFPNETKQLQEYDFDSNTNKNKYLDDFMENNYPHLEAISNTDTEYFINSDYKIVKYTNYKNILVSINATSKNISLIWKYLHTLYILAHDIKPIDNHELYVKNIAEYGVKLRNTNNKENTNNTSSTKNFDDYKDIEEFLENSLLGKFAEELVDDFKSYISEDDINFIKEKANISNILKKIGNPLKIMDKLKDDPFNFLKSTIFNNKKEQERVSTIFANVSSKITEKVQEQTQTEDFINEFTYLLKRYDLWDEENKDNIGEIVEKMMHKLKSNSFNQKKLFADISSIIKNFIGEDINLGELTKNIKSGNMNYEKIFSQANKILEKFGLADGDGVANLAKLAKEMKGAPGMSQVMNMLGRGGGGYRNLSASERRERMRQKLNEVRQRKARTSTNTDKSSSSDTTNNISNKKKRYIKKRKHRKKK